MFSDLYPSQPNIYIYIKMTKCATAHYHTSPVYSWANWKYKIRIDHKILKASSCTPSGGVYLTIIAMDLKTIIISNQYFYYLKTQTNWFGWKQFLIIYRIL